MGCCVRCDAPHLQFSGVVLPQELPLLPGPVNQHEHHELAGAAYMAYTRARWHAGSARA